MSKFAEGLIKIGAHNRVVVLFDNDAEGVEAFEGLRRFKFPANMRATLLPAIEELRSFSARGPSGVENVDINGRAAAIECYLDLRLEGRPPPQVIWTNYKESLDIYHGALESKESYARAFYKATSDGMATGAYDSSKLTIVINSLYAQCTEMATLMFRSVRD